MTRSGLEKRVKCDTMKPRDERVDLSRRCGCRFALRAALRCKAMGINKYYENLIFSGGTKINVSRQVNVNYFDTAHWHPYVEVLVSLRDGNAATINFNRYALGKNDIAIVYSGDLHAVHYVTEDSFLIIQFPIALLAVMGELNRVLPQLSRCNCVRYTPGDPSSEEIMRCVRAIDEGYHSDDPFREVRVYARLLEFFAQVGRMCVRSGQPDAAAGASTEQANMKLMAEACLYISENCVKPLTLNGVASEVGVSKSHFAHLFKDYTNMTFVDFLTSERIKLAESLFPNPKLHIIDIAFESGFSSISTFNRAFRKAKGCSPTEFRATMID